MCLKVRIVAIEHILCLVRIVTVVRIMRIIRIMHVVHIMPVEEVGRARHYASFALNEALHANLSMQWCFRWFPDYFFKSVCSVSIGPSPVQCT